jgi:alpha-L-arabinofuranosidase
VFNLSRNEALPITLSGAAAPSGTVQASVLTSNNITDSNEHQAKVAVTDKTLSNFSSRSPYSVPPFSMTVFKWTSAN